MKLRPTKDSKPRPLDKNSNALPTELAGLSNTSIKYKNLKLWILK